FSLWEDGRKLGPGNCLHDDIRSQGQGRYSVWGKILYFSSSDNGDPRSNDRSYVLRRGRVTAAGSFDGAAQLSGASLDRAMRHLVRNAAPRDDFVPGRVVHVGGSLGPGGAERQILYTLAGVARPPVESAQLLCYYLGSTDRHDFFLHDFE